MQLPLRADVNKVRLLYLFKRDYVIILPMARSPANSDSVLQLLWRRELETDCCVAERISCRITREIILQPSMVFTPAWSKVSSKHVCIGLDRRIYFNNHQLCYFNDGLKGEPCLLYQLPTSGPFAIKIWAVLLYHGHIRRHPCTPEEREVCLLVLSADGFLRVFNADTGYVIRSIFLSTAIKFRYLLWADYLQTVQVKSIQTGRPPRARLGAAPPSRCMVIAVFKIHPLELMACVSIDRKIFGDDIKDASMNEDLLMVIHSNKTFRFYSLKWIIENCTIIDPRLGSEVEGPNGRGIVGDSDFGVPITVKFIECPPLLFETRSGSDCGVSFGGVPTVYLHNGVPSADSLFHIRSLASGEQIGELCTDTMAFHHDVAEFHFDDYQRLLHISGCSVSCYYLTHESGKCQMLSRQYMTDFKKLSQREEHDSMPLRTSSGRIIKRRRRNDDEFDDFTSAVQDLDYENEVELLYAVVTLPTENEGTQALLCFMDDRTGRVSKEVPLPTWKPGAANSIYYELDCIIHLIQESSHSTCHYYRLSRNQ